MKSEYTKIIESVPQLELEQSKFDKEIASAQDLINELNYRYFGPNSTGRATLGKFGSVIFPFYSFGKVYSYFHFEYRELVLFCIYSSLLKPGIDFLDIGGNLGLHSIIASKLTKSGIYYFEPDPIHFSEALKRFTLNKVNTRIKTYRVAISNFNGTSEFVSVKDNTTSSHLSNSGKIPYGPLETFTVKVNKIQEFMKPSQKYLAKIDAEGSEFKILNGVSSGQWDNLNCLVEITSKEIGFEVLNFTKHQNLKIFSQKISWNEAKSGEDIPHNYKEGSILITRNLKRSDIFN